MECKTALKMRWSVPEVAMLTDEWAKVCVDPKTSKLRGEDLNKVVFERYNIRCVQTRQPRRSPQAVSTQRDRMFYFARFVAAFDSKELAQGRPSWFELSEKQQQEVETPNEWRRQAATFSPETLSTFKRIIIPHIGGSKSKKVKKWSSKGKKMTSQATGKQQEVISRVKILPNWSTEEKVRLAQRWGDFVQQKGLPLEGFEAMTYNESCKSLASLYPPRSPFAAWRKARTLLIAWRFITAFNKKHQPGWFELTEVERDSKIKWEELPDKFEDIEPEVFLAMNQAVPSDSKVLHESKDSNEQPTPSVEQATEIVPPLPPSGPSLLLTDSSSDSLDRLLLEDNVVPSSESPKSDAYALKTLGDCCFPPDACSFSAQRLLGDPAIGSAVVSSQPLELIFPSETGVEGLLAAQETHSSHVLQAVSQLQEALDERNRHTTSTIRIFKPKLLSSGNAGLLNHLELVLEQHKNQMLSVLRLVEETSHQHDAEIRSLTQNVLENELKAPRDGSGVYV